MPSKCMDNEGNVISNEFAKLIPAAFCIISGSQVGYMKNEYLSCFRLLFERMNEVNKKAFMQYIHRIIGIKNCPLII